jgi:hypothetical protein
VTGVTDVFNINSKVRKMIYKKQTAFRKNKEHRITGMLGLGAAILLQGFALPAFAHVNYIDVTGGTGGSTFSNFGWYAGTTPALGDTHELAGGDFFNFHLAQDSLVNINFKDNGNTGQLNPAFSLYNGLLPNEGHDDAPADPLNPGHLVTSTTPPAVVKDPSPVDNGIATDAYGRVSPFRDTANVTYVGQFDALHTWSLANDSGDWSVIQYLTHADPAGGNSVSLNNYFLHAGDYTIAAAGGFACNTSTCLDPKNIPLTGLPGTISFSASPVPVPSAFWLMASALAGFGAFGRRKG